VAGGVQEDQVPLGRAEAVGPDVLGDAPGLLFSDPSCPDRIQEAGLAVVDVPHDGYDRRPRPEILGPVRSLGRHLRELLLAVERADLQLVAVLLRHQHRGIVVEPLVDRGEDPHLHHLLDELVDLDPQFFC